MFYDETFVNALEHALPPTAGWGLGNSFFMFRYRQNRYAHDWSDENSGSVMFPSHETTRQQQREISWVKIS